ncbi:MAG: response regulator transcription factor [Candidatus Edwardsbacteria bacterium]|nr:response regulator transcription factor [Candidatus Edwardsbacteria bacterium]
MNLRIVLAEDHKIVREGLRTLLEKQPGFKVVAEAADGATAVRLVQQHSPDLVIMDITMPGLNGIEATRRMIAKNRQLKVIALSMHADQRFVVQILKSGAAGYLLKDSAFDELANAIRAVMNNRTYLSPQIADLVIRNYVLPGQDRDASAFTVLTAKEREVLQLLAEGRTTKEIASEMQVSVKTVETHRKQIMDKLDLHSIAELTKYAVREGLTTL